MLKAAVGKEYWVTNRNKNQLLLLHWWKNTKTLAGWYIHCGNQNIWKWYRSLQATQNIYQARLYKNKGMRSMKVWKLERILKHSKWSLQILWFRLKQFFGKHKRYNKTLFFKFFKRFPVLHNCFRSCSWLLFPVGTCTTNVLLPHLQAFQSTTFEDMCSPNSRCKWNMTTSGPSQSSTMRAWPIHKQNLLRKHMSAEHFIGLQCQI